MQGEAFMLMTLDQWLARFFGASRRSDRPTTLSQRASFGLDGVEMRQVDDDFDWPEWDESYQLDPSPYRPYVRRPRSAFVDPALEFAPPAYRPAPEAFQASPAPAMESYPPVADEERDRLEALAALRSREILSEAAQFSQPQTAPLFQSDIVAESSQEPAAGKFFRLEPPKLVVSRNHEA
jgi:hypothetical protein